MALAPASAHTKIPKFGCGFAVCALLVVLGGAALLAAQKKWNEKRTKETWALAIVGGVLCVAGVGLIAPMQRSVARARERAHREEANPTEPWTWEPAWTTGTGIPESGRRHGGALLFIGVMAIALSLPGVFALPREVARGNHGIWLVLIFPLVGGGFLVSAALAAWRRRKYGLARFVPASIPLPHGGDVAGMIIVDRPVQAERSGRVTLDCWQTTLTRSGNKRQQREESIAHTEREIEAAAWTTTVGESRVFVQLPARGGAATSMKPLEIGRPVHEWRLRVDVPAPGADFVAEFVLPVFEVAGPGGAPGDAAVSQAVPPIALAEVWRAAGIREEPQPGAARGTALVMPERAGRRHVTGPLVMGLVLGGIAGALWFSPVPGVFAAFLTVFAVLPWFAVSALLHRGGERIWVEADAVCTQSPRGPVRRLPLAELELLEPRTNIGIGNKQFFRVQGRRRRDGTRKLPPRFEIAALVPGREAAEQVVTWLQQRVDKPRS